MYNCSNYFSAKNLLYLYFAHSNIAMMMPLQTCQCTLLLIGLHISMPFRGAQILSPESYFETNMHEIALVTLTCHTSHMQLYIPCMLNVLCQILSSSFVLTGFRNVHHPHYAKIRNLQFKKQSSWYNSKWHSIPPPLLLVVLVPEMRQKLVSIIQR